MIDPPIQCNATTLYNGVVLRCQRYGGDCILDSHLGHYQSQVTKRVHVVEWGGDAESVYDEFGGIYHLIRRKA